MCFAFKQRNRLLARDVICCIQKLPFKAPQSGFGGTQRFLKPGNVSIPDVFIALKLPKGIIYRTVDSP